MQESINYLQHTRCRFYVHIFYTKYIIIFSRAIIIIFYIILYFIFLFDKINIIIPNTKLVLLSIIIFFTKRKHIYLFIDNHFYIVSFL
jgi:hypothetical protein